MSELVSPRLVVVGGPNGSGKTTFARSYAVDQGLPYLGADDIAFALAPADPASVRVSAGREFSRRLAEMLAAQRSVVIESTLAGGSLARSVAAAKAMGYEVMIVFVFLDSVALCLRRIAERVAQGGAGWPRCTRRRCAAPVRAGVSGVLAAVPTFGRSLYGGVQRGRILLCGCPSRRRFMVGF
jgi:predicted ABC-type ATPase